MADERRGPGRPRKYPLEAELALSADVAAETPQQSGDAVLPIVARYVTRLSKSETMAHQEAIITTTLYQTAQGWTLETTVAGVLAEAVPYTSRPPLSTAWQQHYHHAIELAVYGLR